MTLLVFPWGSCGRNLEVNISFIRLGPPRITKDRTMRPLGQHFFPPYLSEPDTFCLQVVAWRCFLFFFVLVLVLVGWIGSIFGPPGFAARCGPLCREICSLVPRFPIGGPVAEHGCPRTESSREIVTLRKDWRISQKIWPENLATPTSLNGLDPLFGCMMRTAMRLRCAPSSPISV